MELEDLQKTWRNLTNETPSDLPLDSASLRLLLQGRSRGVLERLRFNSTIEFWINMGCAALLFVGIILENNFTIRMLFGGFLLYEVLLGYYFYRKLSLLKKFVSPDESLKKYLTHLNTQLRMFLTVYKYGNALLMPPAFLSGIVMGTYYNSRGLVAYWMSQDNTMYSLAWLAIGTIAASFLGYMMINWWTNRLYGIHLRRLEEYAQELE